MNIRMILCWAVLQIPITGYCSEWIYVTRDTMGDEFFVDRASFEQDEYKIFFRGLRNYSSPEKRFGSFSSIGKFEADCQSGGIRLHQFDYLSGKMGEGEVINSFPITDREWFNPRQGTVGSKQLDLVCFEIGKISE